MYNAHRHHCYGETARFCRYITVRHAAELRQFGANRRKEREQCAPRSTAKGDNARLTLLRIPIVFHPIVCFSIVNSLVYSKENNDKIVIM